MICFPRVGLTMTNDSNDLMTIKITKDPNNTDYSYLAHTRENVVKDKIYIGAYEGYVDSNNRLRSLSGKAPTVRTSIEDFRTYAHKMGNGYEQLTFYAWTLYQAMYLMKYKNRDSQSAVGYGNVGNAVGSESINKTGLLNIKGLNYGNKSIQTEGVKCLGIEQPWGNIEKFLDGIYLTDNVLSITTDGFENYPYTANYNITKVTSTYIDKVQGITELGFLAKSSNGSQTTGYCDGGSISTSTSKTACAGGGIYSFKNSCGVFRLSVGFLYSAEHASVGTRLMYL